MNNLYKTLKELAVKPKKVDTTAISTEFYMSELTRILKGRFNITCPIEWDKDYMLDALLFNGVFCVTDTDIGIIPLKCSPFGVNVFERATDVSISNPVIGNLVRKIGVDCELVFFNDNKVYKNCWMLLNSTAELMASCDGSINVNLLNTRTPTIFECANTAQVASAKTMYDKISNGEPAIFERPKDITTNEGLRFYTVNNKQSYIADEVIALKHRIYRDFLTSIGIENCDTDKRERLITDETSSKSFESMSYIEYWKQNLKICSKKVSDMFNIEFNIELKKEN